MLRKLGEVLIKGGRVSPEELQTALEYQRHHACHVGQALVELGLATDVEVAQALAQQCEVPFVDLNETPPAPDCLELIPTPLALELGVVPVRMEGDRLLTACLDPSDLRVDEGVRAASGLRILPAAAPESQIRDCLRRHFLDPTLEVAPVELMEEPSVETLERETLSVEEVAGLASRMPTIRVVDFLISDAVRKGASDIHVEAAESVIRVRYRLDGQLQTVLTLSKKLQARICARLKIMSGMDIGESRRPQDGAARVKVEGRAYELRVSTLPGIHGETVVLRILDHNPSLLDLGKLGLQPEMEAELRRLLALRQGMLLITGPTGSGKTTTLYAALNLLNRDPVNIITVEDPVEYKIAGITQVQVNEKAERTFAGVLRSMVRQDPDIIMVGEIRDLETAEIACRAALTGHLVLSTLHTQDAPGALSRLFDIGVAPYIVTASLNGVLAQRLARRVCPKCAEPYRPEPQLLEALEARFGPAPQARFMRGKGCPECHHTGMKGRIGIYELVVVDEALRRLMGNETTLDDMERWLAGHGFRSMEEDAYEKACAGIIPPEEVVELGMGLAADLGVSTEA